MELAPTGTSWSVSLYIVGMAVITFVAVLTIRERYRRDLYATSADVAPEPRPATR